MGSDAHLLRCLLIQQVKRFPEGLQDVASDIRVVNTKLCAKEDEIADDVVGDPFEFVGFKAVFEGVPGAPVCSRLILNVLEVAQNNTLSHGVRV